MTFIVGGARAVISFAMRSGRPLYMVVPEKKLEKKLSNFFCHAVLNMVVP